MKQLFFPEVGHVPNEVLQSIVERSGDELFLERLAHPERVKQIMLCAQSAREHGQRDEDYEDDGDYPEQLPLLVHVNVYLEDRAYGGPEEGGWWYTTGEPILSVLSLPETADDVRADLERRYSNEGRRPMSSVLSQGEYRVCIEPFAAYGYPDRRPHYE